MKNNKKKAFTLVELLVVIAILAVLASVSIVGYLGFTTRAKESVNDQTVTQLNTVLQADEVNHRPESIEDVKEVLTNNGFNNSVDSALKSESFVWNKYDNRIYVFDEKDMKSRFPKEISTTDDSALFIRLNDYYIDVDSIDDFTNNTVYNPTYRLLNSIDSNENLVLNDANLDLNSYSLNVNNLKFETLNSSFIKLENGSVNSDTDVTFASPLCEVELDGNAAIDASNGKVDISVSNNSFVMKSGSSIIADSLSLKGNTHLKTEYNSSLLLLDETAPVVSEGNTTFTTVSEDGKKTTSTGVEVKTKVEENIIKNDESKSLVKTQQELVDALNAKKENIYLTKDINVDPVLSMGIHPSTSERIKPFIIKGNLNLYGCGKNVIFDQSSYKDATMPIFGKTIKRSNIIPMLFYSSFDNNIIFDNINISIISKLNNNFNRAIQIEYGTENHSFLVKNSNIYCTSGIPLALFDSKNQNIAIENSHLNGSYNLNDLDLPGYYAFNSKGLETSVVEIRNSILEGWNAINSHDHATTFNIYDSYLKGVNYNSGKSNSFATLVLDGGELFDLDPSTGKMNVMNFDNCNIYSEAKTENAQLYLSSQYDSSYNNITFKNCNFEQKGNIISYEEMFDITNNDILYIDGKKFK